MSDLSQEYAERVSALVDGRLDGDGFGTRLNQLQLNSQMQANWDAYHVIGRVMRSGALDAQAADTAFVARLSQRLKQETIQIDSVGAAPMVADESFKLPVAANRDNWRRVAGLASVMLVAVLVWQALGPVAQAPSGGHMAQVVVPVDAANTVRSASVNAEPMGRAVIRSDGTSVLTANADVPVMIRDPQLDAMLAAHRNFAGASALQMAPGFVHNANYEEVGR
jgi:sigma-E factor negative regulatory protein RseA